MGTPHDIGALVDGRYSVLPQQQSGNGTINGVSIDRMPSGSQNGFLSAEIVVSSGPIFTGAGPLLDFKLQDSADGSTFADIPASAGGPIGLPQIVALNTAAKVNVNLAPLRRFVRLVATVSGTTTLVDLAGLVVLGGALNPPVA